MNSIPSAQFRKSYAGLHQNTYVTVNGHIIGKWIPMGPAEDVGIVDGEVFVNRDPSYVGTFNSRPFTPVPKK